MPDERIIIPASTEHNSSSSNNNYNNNNNKTTKDKLLCLSYHFVVVFNRFIVVELLFCGLKKGISLKVCIVLSMS